MNILRRLPDSRFSVVERAWQGETVAIIGGGPSLTREQVEMVRAEHLRCIAINAAYLWADFADVCYFADSHFWDAHYAGVDMRGLGLMADQVRERFATFRGLKCSIQGSGNNIMDDAVHIVRGKERWGLSLDPEVLVTGRNSGFQGLNMAILAGASKVLLLGFDGAPVGDRTHWHGGHARPTPAEAYPLYGEAMMRAKQEITGLGVGVITCTPGSVIEAWPRVTLDEALREYA